MIAGWLSLTWATVGMVPTPAPPWIQRGHAFVVEIEVPLATAEACLTDDRFKIVETKQGSGRTAGAVYIAKYSNSSTVSYSECIVLCATVEYAGITASWVSKVYVDNDVAKAAGEVVWGLNKSIGHFDWTGADLGSLDTASGTWPGGVARVVVTTLDGQQPPSSPPLTVLNASFREQPIEIPLQSRDTKSFGIRNGSVLVSKTEQQYGVKVLPSAQLVVGPSSPLFNLTVMSKQSTTVEMVGPAIFNMSAPEPVTPLVRRAASSRAAAYIRTTPESLFLATSPSKARSRAD